MFKKAEVAHELVFEGAWPTTVAFLGSSRKLAAGNQAGQIYIWDLPETPSKEPPPPVRRLDGHTNGVTKLIASKDGKTLYSASFDRTIRIWDLSAPATGTAEAILDGDRRAAEAKKTKKEVTRPGVKVETQQAAHVLQLHKDWVNALSLSYDEKRLISGDDTCLTAIWDLATRKPLAQWTGYPGNWVTAAALSPDCELAFVAEYCHSRSSFDRPPAQVRFYGADGKEKIDVLKVLYPTVKVRDNSYGYAQVWRKLVGGGGLITAQFSPDGKLLAAGQGGEMDTGRIHLLDPETGKLIRTISGHKEGVTDLLFAPDGKHILSAGRDTMIRICQIPDGKEVLTLGKSRGGQFKDWLHAVALAPDLQAVAGADISGLVSVWKVS